MMEMVMTDLTVVNVGGGGGGVDCGMVEVLLGVSWG